MPASAYSYVLIPVESLLLTGFVAWVFRLALRRAGTLPAIANRSAAGFGLVLVVWYAVALGLATNGIFTTAGPNVPVLPGFIVIALLAGIAAFQVSPALRRALDAVPAQWLIAIQTLRVIGVAFLLELADGHLPAAFALPAGWGDAAVGLLAPLVALGLWRRWPGHMAAARAWNILGMADLVTALTMGILTAPGQLELLAREAPNVAISQYPLAMIPAFGVPLFLLLHLATFRALSRMPDEAAPRARAAA